MATQAFADTLTRRFQSDAAPTIVTRTPSKIPIVFSHIVTRSSTVTAPPPPEDAFALHVHLTPLLRADTWIDGRHADLPPVAPGGVCLFDLGASPVAHVHEAMDFVRVYLAQRTIDELSYERGLRAVSGLRIPAFGHLDPVLHGLACALVAAADDFAQTDALFADYVALAFHRRIVQAFGRAEGARTWTGGLAPWQLRRACDLMEAHLADGVAMEELAEACGVSKSYFARAFREAAGAPPHRWLMNARIDRAKALLREGDLPLSEIALVCGFADQSHLTRVFARREGQTPARWRRMALN